MRNNTTTTTCDDGGGGDGDLPPFLFSEDVLIQILVCLPVISLLRFKSVCKSWRALIETPFFIHLHTTTTNTFNSSSSMFGSFIFFLNGNEMFMLSSRSSESVFSDGDNNMDYLGYVPCYDYFAVRMVGSCNGLICIHESRHEVVTLWNPVTRQSRRILPQQITITTEPEWKKIYDFAALGFDVKTKDYKVVLFCCFKMVCPGPDINKWFCRIQVYSLSSNSWRLLEGIHYLPAIPTCSIKFQNQGIYMNGCYFFVGYDESQVWLDGGVKALVCNNSLIYSFDFTKEILTTIQSPDHDSRHDLILTNLGADKIALFMIQRNRFIGGGSELHEWGLDYEYYQIWVLNDEQPGAVVNKESWTKLHSFRKLNTSTYPTQPRCISNNGEFALISTRRNHGEHELQLFNLVTGEVTKDFPLDKSVLRSDVFRESLVSIIGGNGAAETTAERVVGGAMFENDYSESWDNWCYSSYYCDSEWQEAMDDMIEAYMDDYPYILKQRKEDQYVSILKEKKKYHYILKKTERDKCNSSFKKKQKKYKYDSTVRKKKKIDQCEYEDYVIR